MEDDDFMMAAQIRIGALVIPKFATCQAKTKSGKVCGAALSPENIDEHVHSCTFEPHNVRRHHGYACRLAACHEEARQFVDQEAECREFKVDSSVFDEDQDMKKHKPDRAIMDLVTTDSQSGVRRFVDVTVRAGMCPRYRHGCQ